MKKMIATVFGSSSPKPDSIDYTEAYKLGYGLTKQGYTVKNGGYYGTMEASALGVHDAGGVPIGIPLTAFDPKLPNEYCKHQKVDTIFQRLETLILGSHLIVVLPGQLGTLTEFFLCWEMLESKQLNPTPFLACVGERWITLLDEIMTISSIKSEDRELLNCYQNVNQFLNILESITQVLLKNNL
jgi:uncharacterized protein (TIGR00725 family)